MNWPWKKKPHEVEDTPKAPPPRRPVEEAADKLMESLGGRARTRLVCRGLIYDSVVLLDQNGEWLAEVREAPGNRILRVYLEPFEV